MNSSMERIKRQITGCVGKRFDIVAKRGRKKVLMENCVIDSAYPSIFTVKLRDAKSGSVTGVSFSYTDILTKNVCFFPPFTVRSKTKGEKGA